MASVLLMQDNLGDMKESILKRSPMNTRVRKLFTLDRTCTVSRVNERVHSGVKPLNGNSLASVSVKEVLRDMGESIMERRATRASGSAGVLAN